VISSSSSSLSSSSPDVNDSNDFNTTVLFVPENTVIIDEENSELSSGKNEGHVSGNMMIDNIKKHVVHWWKSIKDSVHKEAREDEPISKSTIDPVKRSFSASSGSSQNRNQQHTNEKSDNFTAFSNFNSTYSTVTIDNEFDNESVSIQSIVNRLLQVGTVNPFLLFRVMHVGYVLYLLQCIHHLCYVLEFVVVVLGYFGSFLLSILSFIW